LVYARTTSSDARPRVNPEEEGESPKERKMKRKMKKKKNYKTKIHPAYWSVFVRCGYVSQRGSATSVLLVNTHAAPAGAVSVVGFVVHATFLIAKTLVFKRNVACTLHVVAVVAVALAITGWSMHYPAARVFLLAVVVETLHLEAIMKWLLRQVRN